VIGRVVVLPSCLAAVVPVAEGLPVALVPEEPLVSSVWYGVVHIGGLDVLAFFHALHAERVRLQVTLACLLPCPAVATGTGASYLLGMERLVFLTVLGAVRNQRRTAGMAAWGVWSIRHFILLLGRGVALPISGLENNSPHILSWERPKVRVVFEKHRFFYFSHGRPFFPKGP
jgi:hypothetical protein